MVDLVVPVGAVCPPLHPAFSPRPSSYSPRTHHIPTKNPNTYLFDIILVFIPFIYSFKVNLIPSPTHFFFFNIFFWWGEGLFAGGKEGRKEAQARLFVCSPLADVPLVVLQRPINWQGSGARSTAGPGKGRDPASPAPTSRSLSDQLGPGLPAAFTPSAPPCSLSPRSHGGGPGPGQEDAAGVLGAGGDGAGGAGTPQELTAPF